VDQLSLEEQQVLTLLYKLETNPKDVDAQHSIAILYDQMSETNIRLLPLAIQHYETLRELAPKDADTRNDLSTAYFRNGQLDLAIKEATAVLSQEPDHINANFNLGIFYMNTKPKQYQKAANQFEKVVRLTQNSPSQLNTLGRARSELDAVVKAAQAAGTPVKLNGGTL
jgi:predicted Zn-dependent protease